MKAKKCYLHFIIPLLFCCLIIFCLYKFYLIEQSLYEMRQDINTMNLHNASATQSEYTQTIDFLENEFVKYREFAERQQNFLIWLLGIIGTSLIVLFTFFEIRGRKDISKLIREQYANQIQDELSHFIGGQDKINYLINCIEKEENARKKVILFLFQHNENENLKKVYKILKDLDYQVKKKKISRIVTDRAINRWTDESDIIIYQVDQTEFRTNNPSPGEDVTYAKISKACNSKQVYGILYCENSTALDRTLYDSYFYINNANYGLTLMERIFFTLNIGGE